MRNGPALVIRGTLIGSLVVALLGWILSRNIVILPAAEVAYAASPTQNPAQPAPSDDCVGESPVPAGDPAVVRDHHHICRQVELPPNLIAAVILQESGGDATAYSSSGAVGLMQVMPRDGIAASFECINGPCFASRPTIEELQDPRFNIEYGTRMLARFNRQTGQPA